MIVNRLVSSLKHGMSESAVADLQDALLECLNRNVILAGDERNKKELLAVLKRERSQQHYGDATLKLVAIFQQERNLQASGEVDNATADALNDLLNSWGLLSKQEQCVSSRIVTGTVLRQDMQPLPGTQVRAFHQTKDSAIRLGDDRTDFDGRYTIRYESLPGVDGINLQVVVFGDDGKKLQSSNIIENAGALETVKLLVNADTFYLRGILLADHGVAVEGITLSFYQRSFGGYEKPLEKTVTAQDGSFAVELAITTKSTALDIRALINKQEISLTESGRQFSSGETLSLLIPSDKLPAPKSEFERLLSDLRPRLGGLPLSSAKEDDERRDITLLHQASGWDARLIALAASAEQLAEHLKLDTQAAYALVRAGLPADPMQLARVSSAGIEHALTHAMEAGVVSLSQEQVTLAKNTLDAFGRKERRKLAMFGTASTYGSMLKATGLGEADQDRFDEIFSAHTGDTEELWKKVRAVGLPDDQLKLSAQLGVFTLNSSRLVENLREEIGSTARMAETLVKGGLYKTEAWEAKLKTLARNDERLLSQMIPSAFEGEVVSDRLQAYAKDLAANVKRSYPMQILAEQLRTGELTLDSTANTPATAVASVLERAAEREFAFGQQPFSQFLSDNNEVLFNGIASEQQLNVTAELKTLYRQYQLSASEKGFAALRKEGLHSARDVAAMPRQEFLSIHGHAFPSLVEADLTWHRAHQISAVALNVVTMAKQLDWSRPLLSMAQPPALITQAQASLTKQYPTLESLFGSLDFCECSHCRSVLSPAAYLVDLLKFIDDAPGKPKKPYTALIERRPDLPHLKLTCENTLTPLPYIDIVNEILEFWLVQNPHRLTPAVAYDTGDAISEDLIAEPQNLLPEAYARLKSARYPLTAPFDLWLATVRAFTHYFEVPFWQLLDALNPSEQLYPAAGESYGMAAIAYERLGISQTELSLMTTQSSLNSWPELFGYAAASTTTAITELSRAKVLARKLGVSYRELLTLLRTRFVNPTQSLVLVDPETAGACSWEDTRLQHRNGSAVNDIDLLLLNFLVRLWRRFSWTIQELDEALVTFLPTTPNPRSLATIGPAMASALLGLSHLTRLFETLNVGRAGRRSLLPLWGRLSDTRYEELFLSGTTQTRNPAFAGPPGNYLSAPGVLLHEHQETVQAALQLTAEEIGRILEDVGLEPENTPLTMENVSLLHRYGLLAKLLKLSVADLLVLKDLTDLNPFMPLLATPVSSSAEDHPFRYTIRFVEKAQQLRASGLTVEDMDFLTRHRFDPVGSFRNTSTPPLSLVRALTLEISRIRAEHAVPIDPLTFTDDQLVRTLGLVFEPTVVQLFLDAWSDPSTALPSEIFETRFKRHLIPGVGEVGFLEGADLPLLFNVVPGDQAGELNRRARLTATLLPYVQQHLIRQAVVTAAAIDLGGDAELVDMLLNSSALIEDPEFPGQPLLNSYLAAGNHGLTMTDGKLTGYFEVPVTGGYQLTVRSNIAAVQINLSFDHLSEPVLVATTADDNLELTALVELRAGVPYGFTLDYTAGAEVGLWLRGQQLLEAQVETLITYPRAKVTALHRRHILMAKVLRLVDRLKLTNIELKYLLTHRQDFANLNLSKLPTSAGVTPQIAREGFEQILRLINYVRLRSDLAAEPQDLIDLFAHARKTLPAGADPADVGEEILQDMATRLAAITRRREATLVSAITLTGQTTALINGQVVAAGFINEQGLARLWRILSLAARLGVDPMALGRWATLAPDDRVARDVRDTVKAKYSLTQWRQVAQPIFDKLRQQRRDALVAQILQITGYERMEQLFEHFLVDPGTEPVVHTSRLRLAISSVQTFIQRCLLNLEKDVSPASIHADRWEWMKRYRVWEANRKIFLWPENWLEPEFRDDKTHLFTELEASLLESDLNDEAVEAALHQYLAGLEEIARLDIRSIYQEQRLVGNVLHVVARTASAPHKYFYRTWAHRSWTPWQPVTADIESDHVVIVVWRERVHLFWVQIIPQSEAAASSSIGSKTTAQLTASDIAAMRPRKMVDVLLFSSSLFQGEWSDPVLLESDAPITKTVNQDFRARNVHMWGDVLDNGAVSLSLLGGGINQSFTVYSPYAPPEQSTTARIPINPPYLTGNAETPLQRVGQGRWRGDSPRLAVHLDGHTIVNGTLRPCDMTQDILAQTPYRYHLVMTPPPAKRYVTGKKGKAKLASDQPAHAPEDPFFFLDRDHTFYVEPEWFDLPIWQADKALVAQTPVWHEFDRVEYWRERQIRAAFPLTEHTRNRPPNILEKENVVTDVIIHPDTLVTLGDRPIGPNGGLMQISPGDLVRTGPQGRLVRTHSLNIGTDNHAN